MALQKYREKPIFRFYACTLFREGVSPTAPSVEPNSNKKCVFPVLPGATPIADWYNTPDVCYLLPLALTSWLSNTTRDMRRKSCK